MPNKNDKLLKKYEGKCSMLYLEDGLFFCRMPHRLFEKIRCPVVEDAEKTKKFRCKHLES